MSDRDQRSGGSLRLHLNENTAGCSPAVMAALRSLTPDDVACYPDYDEVNDACARWLGVPREWVQLTNGLDEGLHVAAQHARKTADERGLRSPEALVIEPAFDMYVLCAEAAGLIPRQVMPPADLRLPLDAALGAISPATSLVYLTDPNNPTGLAMPPGALDRILDATTATVLLDEAYADFSGRTAVGPALDRHRHLIVGRTFAKGHGLAGLRIGALVAHPDTLAPVRRLLPPFNVNVAAARALGAALADRAWLDAYVAESRLSRELIYAWCRQRSLGHWPSEANFVLIHVGDPTAPVVAGLAAHGVLVRDRTGAPGCGGCIRIAAGLVEHTRAGLAALETVLATRAR
jgi:histidinol-phosphate aminotransferase